MRQQVKLIAENVENRKEREILLIGTALIRRKRSVKIFNIQDLIRGSAFQTAFLNPANKLSNNLLIIFSSICNSQLSSGCIPSAEGSGKG